MTGWLESQYFWWGIISTRGIPLYNFKSSGM